MRLPGASSNAKGAALRRGPGGARGVAYFLPMLQRASGPGCRRRRCCCRARCGCPGGSGRPCRACGWRGCWPGTTVAVRVDLEVHAGAGRTVRPHAAGTDECVIGRVVRGAVIRGGARAFGKRRRRPWSIGVDPGFSRMPKIRKALLPGDSWLSGGGSRPATRIVRDPRTPRNAHRSSVDRGSIE